MPDQTHPKTNRTSGRRWVAAVVVTADALALGVAHAQASPRTLPAEVREWVPFASHGHVTFFEGADHSCPAAEEGTTVVAFRSGADYGDEPGDTFVGSSVTEGCLYLRADGVATGHGETEFTGTFGNCGTGSLSFDYVASISAPHPTTELRDSIDLGWAISGSGTGELADVHIGSYMIKGTVAPDLSATGPLTGGLQCAAS